jgi:large subunit ribosomal protein L25
MPEQIAIKANKREALGKHAKKLLTAEKLPAVLYGHELPSQPIEVNHKEFVKAFKKAGESTLVSLELDGQSRPVLIHDVQNHYLHGHPIHADFYAVNMKEKLKTDVAIHFVGESAAVKTMGGVLVRNLNEVEVECLPADLPPYFEIDISVLNTFDDAIHVSDIPVSDKVKILANPEEVISNVAPPRTEEEMAELESAPVAEDVSAVEGVAEEKEDEEGEEKDKKAEKVEGEAKEKAEKAEPEKKDK